eukprot:5306147-Amphidinium_carterae.1
MSRTTKRHDDDRRQTAANQRSEDLTLLQVREKADFDEVVMSLTKDWGHLRARGPLTEDEAWCFTEAFMQSQVRCLAMVSDYKCSTYTHLTQTKILPTKKSKNTCTCCVSVRAVLSLATRANIKTDSTTPEHAIFEDI